MVLAQKCHINFTHLWKYPEARILAAHQHSSYCCSHCHRHCCANKPHGGQSSCCLLRVMQPRPKLKCWQEFLFCSCSAQQTREDPFRCPRARARKRRAHQLPRQRRRQGQLSSAVALQYHTYSTRGRLSCTKCPHRIVWQCGGKFAQSDNRAPVNFMMRN